MEFSSEKKSISELIKMKDQIKFDTKFQRGGTWKRRDKQYFMDTVRRNWQTSKIFFWVPKHGECVCVDGQQRLKTIFSFFKNGFGFSDRVPGKLSGKKLKDLKPEQLKKINDYKFDVVTVKKASINDVADFFIRLQLGVPLNPAEKLNAILGDVRDFVCEVSQHDFFKKTICVRDYRFSHRYLAAQIVLLAKEGAHNLKYPDLREMYKVSLEDEIQEIVKKRLDFLREIFPRKATYIRNRATVTSLFYFVNKEFSSLFLSSKVNILRDFFKEFQEEYYRQSKLDEDNRDSELQIYQLYVVQAADTATAIEERHKILRRRFLEYEKETSI